MTIQVNTDKHIEGSIRLKNFITEELESSLERFSDKLTRIEVHLSDENGGKGGADDKRCLLEARIENMQPIAVTNFDSSTDQAISGAIDKLKSALDTVFGKMQNR
ncbi:MAG: HPF/RaiA family ribosome-associated protein [Chitinophagaceae bacterium]|jgi:ribosome-associated translation inhibitor RaiA|nr:HPF/RaiA family ribosome-associated protein [Chitinophagaceae bacterium]